VRRRSSVYTAEDYAQIIEFLNRRWELADRSFTKGTSLEAQEYLMTLPDRIRRLAKAAARRKAKKGVKEAEISWIYNRSIQY
jgi:acyl-[acyl-carrier-protein] desaturase